MENSKKLEYRDFGIQIDNESFVKTGSDVKNLSKMQQETVVVAESDLVEGQMVTGQLAQS